ncbi:hypothetical protein IFR04_004750 [Cadophora malorum]|uniref:Uncharacterized protein n=1 Tax=Cadophora malorum TaxID=108018 RepID=A0A8H8BSI7_9HELO|nr:hypothetical protein IFR04_004750 [Cadophora malorum]
MSTDTFDSSSISISMPQVIEGQYLDQRRFMNLLKQVYGTSGGKNNFRVELRLNRYKIYPMDQSTKLTEVNTKPLHMENRHHSSCPRIKSRTAERIDAIDLKLWSTVDAGIEDCEHILSQNMA